MEFLWFVALAALIAIAGMPMMKALAGHAFDLKEVRRRLTGHHQPLESSACEPPLSALVSQPLPPDAAMAARLRELAISFDGRDYRYGDYRYERRDDAIAYALLLQAKIPLMTEAQATATVSRSP